MRPVAIAVTVALVTLIAITFQPVSQAYATGYTASIESTRFQAHEAIAVSPNDPCPTSSSETIVKARLYYSGTSTSYAFGGQVASSGMTGSWVKGYVTLSGGVSAGSYDLQLTCELHNGSVTRTYDTIPIEIVGNSPSGYTVDKVQWFGRTHIESTTPCPTESTVEIKLYSSSSWVYGPSGYRTYDVVKYVNTDVMGNWEYDIDLEMHRQDGFYFIRATCTIGPIIHYDSYRFTLTKSSFVALGDSFSAGTGTFNIDLNSTYCRRSSENYAFYIHNNSSRGIEIPNVQACNGAATFDVVENYDVPQVDALGFDTEYVTITIGGNDIGFESVLKRCVNWAYGFNFGCSTDGTVTGPVYDRINAYAGGASQNEPTYGMPIHSIEEVLTTITTLAPNAEVYVAGYPHLFGDSVSNFSSFALAPSGYICNVYTAAVPIRFDYDDAQWINAQADQINSIIRGTVDGLAYAGKDVHYVSPSNFDGHGLCDSNTAWINEVSFDGIPGPDNIVADSFHPTDTGYDEGYGRAFVDEID